MPTFQHQVSKYRLARGWSQGQLAQRSGLSRAAISAIETSRVVPSTAAALTLAATFECRVEDLFSLGARSESSELNWAWAPHSDPCRVWRATVGEKTFLYPVERTAVGLLPADGTVRDGALEKHAESDPQRVLVIAGCDPAVGLLCATLQRVAGIVTLPLVRSSRQALELLRAGVVHFAGLHLQDRTTPAGNARAVRQMLGRGYSLLRVTRWQEGLALAPSLSIHTLKDAVSANLRWVAREEGSGARHCLDDIFRGHRIPRHAFDHVAADHFGVVETIRTGWAQAGVCIRLCAVEAGLEFLAARDEDYDLCYRTEFEDDLRLAALFDAVRSQSFRHALGELPGYDTAATGSVVSVGAGRN